MVSAALFYNDCVIRKYTNKGNTMTNKSLLRGISTISFYAADMKAAREWYSNLLGMQPYFQQPNAENPAYIEFRLGDYQHELGIIDAKYKPQIASSGAGGAIVFWHVDNLEEAVAQVKALGATEYEPITTRGEGFVTASVIDLFGNILGPMYNKHYLEILAASQKS